MAQAAHSDATANDEARRTDEEKAHAYAVGRAALKARQITRPAHELYEMYVRYTGDKEFCWPGVEVLCAELDCKDRALTRANECLLKAGLIERERRMGTTWRTYITAYKADVQAKQPPTFLPDVHSALTGGCDPVKNGGCDPVKTDGCDPPQSADVKKEKNKNPNHQKENNQKPPRAREAVAAVAGQIVEATVEVAKDDQGEPNGATPLPNSAAPSPLKLPSLAERLEGLSEPERRIYDRLAAARHPRTNEVIAQKFTVISALQESGRLELEFVEQLLDYCGKNGKGWGLLLYLAQHPDQFEPAPPNGHYVEHDHATYAAQATPTAQVAHEQTTLEVEEQTTTTDDPHSAQDDRSTWTAVQALLRETVSGAEFVTWLEPLQMLAVEADVIVIGAPNVFVRQEVDARYVPDIAEALAIVLGQAVEVDVVIGS